ncbi:hypothetical protein JKP88DRAFT_351438 [Tribonema minus]|uniref:Uncharacterized protein n=1 Tax=Tribonema minus TaxID=303371 RepID=A0A836C746_9STRA|nr:hypothetical protein JKP88DRAFT_351438 [Tribonema minus]
MESLQELATLATATLQKDNKREKDNAAHHRGSHDASPAGAAQNKRLLLKKSASDWHVWLTIEDRTEIRRKIASAYRDACRADFEQLLETAAAIEEEWLFASAPSRLDYFKTGVQYDKRVTEKIEQLRGARLGRSGGGGGGDGGDGSVSNERGSTAAAAAAASSSGTANSSKAANLNAANAAVNGDSASSGSDGSGRTGGSGGGKRGGGSGSGSDVVKREAAAAVPNGADAPPLPPAKKQRKAESAA